METNIRVLEWAHRARKVLLMFTLLISAHHAASQTWLPKFRVSVNYRPVIMANASLQEFLQYGHPWAAKGCHTRMSVFYFRVNHLGKVDSLFSEGNFTKEEKEVISRNILATSDNWILPANTTSENFCWFLYPCFILGRLVGPCADDPQNQEQIKILRRLLSDHSEEFDKQGRYLLPPNDYGFHSRR